MERSGKAWFAPKRYGYGAGLPVAWRGWAALALFVALTILAAVCLQGLARIAAWVVLTAAFCALAAAKTDGGWRWRRGPDR